MDEIRIGMGIDFHRLAEGRALILGGVSVPYSRGLAGHSDADVVVHALCDALLGAAGLGDIGLHFPDSDARYKDISSLLLLDRVVALLTNAGYRPKNVDCVVIAQEPRLAPYFPAMRETLAPRLCLAPTAIGLKATKSEGMGAIGRGEGIGATAVCLIQRAAECPGRSPEA
jgi:2-C-methyl-D-erythritol 2,4-cyclodiphosphate synthase